MKKGLGGWRSWAPTGPWKGPVWPMLSRRDGGGFIPSQGCRAQQCSWELGVQGNCGASVGSIPSGIPAASSALARGTGGCSSGSVAPKVFTILAQGLENKWE